MILTYSSYAITVLFLVLALSRWPAARLIGIFGLVAVAVHASLIHPHAIARALIDETNMGTTFADGVQRMALANVKAQYEAIAAAFALAVACLVRRRTRK